MAGKSNRRSFLGDSFLLSLSPRPAVRFHFVLVSWFFFFFGPFISFFRFLLFVFLFKERKSQEKIRKQRKKEMAQRRELKNQEHKEKI